MDAFPTRHPKVLYEYTVSAPGIGAAPHRLHQALLDASLPITTVLGEGADTVTVLSEEADLQAAIDAVVAAFDPQVPSTGEVQEEADSQNMRALRDQYQTLKNGLDTIRTSQETVRSQMDTIEASPNPTTANLANLVGVANAVKQVAQGIEQVSSDITTMTQGLDRLLDTLAVIVRRVS